MCQELGNQGLCVVCGVIAAQGEEWCCRCTRRGEPRAYCCGCAHGGQGKVEQAVGWAAARELRMVEPGLVAELPAVDRLVLTAKRRGMDPTWVRVLSRCAMV